MTGSGVAERLRTGTAAVDGEDGGVGLLCPDGSHGSPGEEVLGCSARGAAFPGDLRSTRPTAYLRLGAFLAGRDPSQPV
jgi:hypothetical protein